jgi:hypothetical protein
MIKPHYSTVEVTWSYSPSCSAASPIVPLVAKTNLGPNVAPLSLLPRITGVYLIFDLFPTRLLLHYLRLSRP